MDIEGRPLRCFAAVAETRSFTKAAKQLHITQPTLSMQIKELERQLGFALFHRTTRRIDLTVEGEAFLTDAKAMIAEGDRMKNAIKALRLESARRLTLGAAFYTIDIPERVRLIERFMAAHPEISLDIDNRWQNELVAELPGGRLDLALVIGMPVARKEHDIGAQRSNDMEILYPDDMKQLVLRREPVGLLVPRESPLARHKRIPLAALEGFRISMLSQRHGAQVFDPIAGILQNAGAELVIPPEGNGIGVERYGRQFRIPAVTLGWFAEHNATGSNDMVRRPVEGIDITTNLTLLAPPHELRAPARTFWSFTAKGKAGLKASAAKASYALATGPGKRRKLG